MEKIVLEEVVLEDKRENSDDDDSNHIETKCVRDNHDEKCESCVTGAFIGGVFCVMLIGSMLI